VSSNHHSLQLYNKKSDTQNYEDNFTLDELRPILENKKLYNIQINKEYNKNYNNTTCWTYDTGASEHVTNNKNILKNFIKRKIKMTCANNSTCTFEGYGTYYGTINGFPITLNNVYYSKQINKNLISGIKFSKTGYNSIITQQINNKPCLIIKNKENDNIYKTYSTNDDSFYIFIKTNKSNINKLFNINDLNTDYEKLWHNRLGHFYQRNINKYLSEHNVKLNKCEECQASKLKRKPHNKITPKASQINEIIHSDLIGPFSLSVNNKKYIITFIDEFSKHAWVFLLSDKKQASKNYY